MIPDGWCQNRENGAPLSVASPEDRGCSKEAGEDV